MNIPPATTDRRKPTTPEVRTRLTAYRDTNNLSHRQLGRELGMSSSQVSRYLSDKFEGDVDLFEAKAEDVLRTAPIRQLVGCETFETGVTKSVAGTINLILKTNDFGVIYGPAGIGKSVAAARYQADNATAILVSLAHGCRDAKFIQKTIFARVKSRAFAASGMNRAEWIIDRLKGSNRLLLLDNGQRLTIAAREYLFDLHDATRCPVVLFGNPEIIDQIKSNDQQFSRIGICPEIKLKDKECPDIAARIIAQMCPEHHDALIEYATKIVTNQGHIRSLRKQITLALHLSDEKKIEIAQAFRAGHTMQIRSYSLEGK
ncbi:MAG: AAA family ATPase [Verrucomicrobiae bacterium]